MAKRSKEELLERISTVLGDRMDDDALSLIEDVTDSYDSDSDEWRRKYEETDRTWREKYKERFFMTPSNRTTTPETVVDDNAEDLKTEGEEKTIDELFEEREEGNSGY